MANKRVTRYVVIQMDRDFDKYPVAVFKCPEIAKGRADYLTENRKGLFKDLRYYVEPIRFRTPEVK